VIVEAGVGALVVGIRDPHPRVDGAGLAMVRAAGIEVVEEVCAGEVRHQLAPWILQYHRHEPLRVAAVSSVEALIERYGVDRSLAEVLKAEGRRSAT